jgi:hypothetical protein
MTSRKKWVGSAVELVIIGVLVVAVAGLVVWRFLESGVKPAATTAQTAKTTQATQTSTTTASSDVKYLVVKEWNVQFPYESSDTLSYVMHTNGDNITVVSSQLQSQYATCDTYGAGQINRVAATDAAFFGDGATVAATYGTNESNGLGILDGKYYIFMHDQAVCGLTGSEIYTDDSNSAYQLAGKASNKANDFTQSIVQNVEVAK